jgi:hypothetical protein
VTVSAKDFVTLAPALSVTRAVKLYDPAFVGLPEITPEAARERPGGSEPAVLVHEYGGVPPEAARLVEYATREWACGSGDDVVIASGGGGGPATVIESAFDAVWVPSVTRSVKENVPAAVGVPVTVASGVPELRLRPGGRAPDCTLQV